MNPFTSGSVVPISRVLVLCALSSTVVAQPQQEGIVYDPASGDYTLTYCCDDQGQIAVDTFEPSTKVMPWVDSTLGQSNDGQILYGYGISISKDSMRPLEMIVLDPVQNISNSGSLTRRGYELPRAERSVARKAVRDALRTPNGWTGFANPSRNGGLRVGWARHRIAHLGYLEAPHGEFNPGSAQKGFGFESADLPGIGIMQFKSTRTAPRAYSGEGPAPGSEVAEALGKLEENDFIPRFAAVPTFSAPSPLVATQILDAVRSHVASWPAQNLMDRRLFAEVDAALATALAASREGDLKRARKELQSVRQSLHQQFGALDDDLGSDVPAQLTEHDRRLAARVLDFTVKSILKRLDE